MSLIDRDYFASIVEGLLGQHSPKEGASLFHHRCADDRVERIEEGQGGMMLTVVPHQQLDTPLDLREHLSSLHDAASAIGGVRRTEWRSAGFILRFAHGEHPYLCVHRRGAVEYGESNLLERGAVVPVRVLRPLIGTVEVIRKLAEDAGLDGHLQVDVSLLGVEGAQFHTPPRRFFHGSHEFDSDRIHQRWTIEVDGERSDLALRPLAHMLWQSSGFEECHQYNADGEWARWDEHFG